MERLFTWGICEYISGVLNYKCNNCINLFFQSLIPAIILIFVSPMIASYLCRQDSLYRKFNLYELEIKIINRILNKEYMTDEIEDYIVGLYFNETNPETEESEQNGNET